MECKRALAIRLVFLSTRNRLAEPELSLRQLLDNLPLSAFGFIMPARKSRGSMATPSSTTSHKRQLSETAATVTPGSRTSKRLKDSAEKVKSTPTKSKYFADLESGDDDVPESADELADSGYEDEDHSATEEPSEAETGSDDEFDSEEDGRKRRPKVRANKSKLGATSAISTVLEKGKELWREGVSTGLGPGKQVFIEKPKPRGDGGIKYVPERIHPHTMAFLKDLKNNNDREWLKSMCELGSARRPFPRSIGAHLHLLTPTFSARP